MNKPIKPVKPTKSQSPPTKTIVVSKLLVFNNHTHKYELIDHVSHPHIFEFDAIDNNGKEIRVVNDELEPSWEALDEACYDYNHETLSYMQYKRIYTECSIPADDFEVVHRHNCDGYYENSIAQYSIADTEYNKKLEQYNDRFANYEKQLAIYEVELTKYNEFKLKEKKRKLEDQLKNLK